MPLAEPRGPGGGMPEFAAGAGKKRGKEPMRWRCFGGGAIRRRVIVGLLAAGITGFGASAATPRTGASPPSADYILALRTTNSFLAAWSSRDADAGVALMSHALLAPGGTATTARQAELRQFVEGPSNPGHQAFDVAAGIRRSADRYAFPVTLFELYQGADHGDEISDTLEVVRDDDGWRVDRLPRSADGGRH